MPEDLGPYRVSKRIASGGMAEIYLARHRGMEGVDRAVVVKRIHPQYAVDDEFVTMFLDEARLMAALAHPNIAQVLDLGRVGDSYYLVMEYVRGPTLAALIEASQRAGQRGLPMELALPILHQVAEAIAYLHEARDEFGRPLEVVHRDLNPSNVIVAYTGAVKLIDFGIAKTAIKVYETRHGVVKGTYGYIAPEQLRGEPVDSRADLFSLGVLMYEMCTGELPFGPGEAPDLLDRILRAQYRRPSRVNPDFPLALEPLIQRCLAPNLAERLPSMRAFIDALGDHMASRRLGSSLMRVGDQVRALVPDGQADRPLVIRRVGSEPRASLPPAEDDATETSASALRISSPAPRDEADPTLTHRSAPSYGSQGDRARTQPRSVPPGVIQAPAELARSVPPPGRGRAGLYGFCAGTAFAALVAAALHALGLLGGP